MEFNKSNKEENEDLKFIPLNIKEPFIEEDSNWIPMINMNYPNVNNMTNNFMFGFSSPKVIKSTEYLSSIDYDDTNTYKASNGKDNILNKGSSNQSGYMNNEILSGNNAWLIPNDNSNNDNFSLEFPSQVESENLYSYNKNIKCKPINATKTKSLNGNNEENKKKEIINQSNYQVESFDNINNVWENPNLDPTNSILGDPLNVDLGFGLREKGGICNPSNIISTNPMSVKNEFISSFNNHAGNKIQNTNNKLNMPCNAIKLEDLFIGSGDMMDNYNFKEDLLNNDYNITDETLLGKSNEEIDEPIHMGMLRKLNLGSECENFYRTSEDEVNKIFKSIEDKHCSVLETLKQYNLPDSVITEIVRNTIKLALSNSNNE